MHTTITLDKPSATVIAVSEFANPSVPPNSARVRLTFQEHGVCLIDLYLSPSQARMLGQAIESEAERLLPPDL